MCRLSSAVRHLTFGKREQNMNILITGGCGFIGVNLIGFFQKNTSGKIVVLDNLSVGKTEYLSEFDVEFVKGDIRNPELVQKLMKKVDAVIHLAADTQVISSINNPDFNFDVNANGTFILLNMAKNEGIEHFVFASTGGAIIGDVTPPVRETMVPRPVSLYGASKLCGEAYCSAFAGSYGMKTVSLRFSNVYGPGSFHKGSVVAHFFKQILKRNKLTVHGNGKQTRDFIYVDDLCDAILRALNIEKGGQFFQIGSGVETSVNELIELIKTCIGDGGRVSVEYAPARKGEVFRNYSDISLARDRLGFVPKMPLEEGLKKTWEELLCKFQDKMFQSI